MFAVLRIAGRDLRPTRGTSPLSSPYRDEKDSQGENMFLRCVSELVIESREVRGCPFLSHPWLSLYVLPCWRGIVRSPRCGYGGHGRGDFYRFVF